MERQSRSFAWAKAFQLKNMYFFKKRKLLSSHYLLNNPGPPQVNVVYIWYWYLDVQAAYT